MTPLKIFSLALRRRLQTKKKSGPENNRSLAKKLRQKPNDDKNISIESISIYNRIHIYQWKPNDDKNIFNNIFRPENCEVLSKIN